MRGQKPGVKWEVVRLKFRLGREEAANVPGNDRSPFGASPPRCLGGSSRGTVLQVSPSKGPPRRKAPYVTRGLPCDHFVAVSYLFYWWTVRGWTHDHRSSVRCRDGSPACAGMDPWTAAASDSPSRLPDPQSGLPTTTPIRLPACAVLITTRRLAEQLYEVWNSPKRPPITAPYSTRRSNKANLNDALPAGPKPSRDVARFPLQRPRQKPTPPPTSSSIPPSQGVR